MHITSGVEVANVLLGSPFSLGKQEPGDNFWLLPPLEQSLEKGVLQSL